MTEKRTMIGKEWQIPVFSSEEGQRRWKKIRELMIAREIDCLLIQYWNEKVSWVPIVHCKSERRNYPKLIADTVKDLGLEKGTLGIVDKYTWFIYSYEGVKELLPSAKFVEADEILKAVRRVKSPAELEYIRKAGECADKGWEAMLNVAKPRVTEYELSILIHDT